MGKHSHLTDKQLAAELQDAKRLIDENLRQAQQLRRLAEEMAEESDRRAKASLEKP